MQCNLMIHLLLWGGMLLLGMVALWYKGKANTKDTAIGLIAQAEEMFKEATEAGGTKFEWVVNQIYRAIPAPVRPFIPRSMVEAVVQGAFDMVKTYAEAQLDKISEKVEEELNEPEYRGSN